MDTAITSVLQGRWLSREPGVKPGRTARSCRQGAQFFQGSQGRVGARPSLPPGPARRPAAPAHSSPVPRPRPKLAYIYPALTMHDNEVMVTEGSGESLYRSLVCNVGAGGGGPAPARGGPAPSTTAVPAEDEKVEAEKEESEESDDDVGFGLFD
ncbi:hypothetical protein CB1_001793016 [Camelus ferus]|nr:hypothetical protein CB1_001793016 [Camelus ferus]